MRTNEFVGIYIYIINAYIKCRRTIWCPKPQPSPEKRCCLLVAYIEFTWWCGIPAAAYIYSIYIAPRLSCHKSFWRCIVHIIRQNSTHGNAICVLTQSHKASTDNEINNSEKCYSQHVRVYTQGVPAKATKSIFANLLAYILVWWKLIQNLWDLNFIPFFVFDLNCILCIWSLL